MSGTVLFASVYVYDAESDAGMFGPIDVLVRDGHIAVIGGAIEASDEELVRVIDGGGTHLLVPGLINAHFHSPANHLKGSLPSMPLELFMLYESPVTPELAPTPREAYLRTMLAALEMIRTGCTSVQDDAFLMPAPSPEIIDAVMQAYADSGLRVRVALDQPELAEADKLPDPANWADDRLWRGLHESPSASRHELLALYDHLISTWHGSHGGRLQAAVSVSAPQRVSPEYYEALNELSERHDLPLYSHMLETKVQRTLATTQSRFAGRSIVEYVDDLGLLNERTNVIHAVWVDDRDLRIIADSGATIAHNPVSNLRLGSGIAPFRRIRDFSIPLALGVDEAICDDTVNMWGVVKAAGLIHNIDGSDSDRWPAASEVLEALWSGGATAMRAQGDIGVIREGAFADLALLDLHTPAFTPFNDLRGQLVYCESGSSVRVTMVAGEVLYEAGRVVKVDESALLDEARGLFALKLPTIQRERLDSRPLEIHYKRMIEQAAVTDVGFSRWVGNRGSN